MKTLKLISDDFGYTCGIIAIVDNDKDLKKCMRVYMKNEYDQMLKYLGTPSGKISGGVWTKESIIRTLANRWVSILTYNIHEFEINEPECKEIYHV